EMPLFFPGGGVQCIKLRVAATSIDDTIGHGGPRRKTSLIVNLGSPAPRKAAPLRSFFGRSRPECTVPCAVIQQSVFVRGRGMDDVPGRDFPAQVSAHRVDRVEVSITASKVDGVLGNDRAGKEDVEGIRNRLVFWLQPVNSFRFEPALASGSELPAYVAVSGIERIQFSVVTDGEKSPVAYDRCGR